MASEAWSGHDIWADCEERGGFKADSAADVGHSSGSNSDDRDEEESGSVSSRTQSRHGGLLAVVDVAPTPCWVPRWRDGSRWGQVRSGEIHEDRHSLECEGVPQRGVADGPGPFRPLLSTDGSTTEDKEAAVKTVKHDLKHHFLGSEEGVRYHRELAALVQKHEADWRHTQSIRQEGEAAAAYRHSLRYRLWEILWSEVSDWVLDSTATDAIEKLKEDMDLLRNYTAVLVAKIQTRFDNEFLIQAAIAELRSHIASYNAAIWRLVSGHRLTPPLLSAEGRNGIWTRWTRELTRVLPFGEEMLLELTASYRLEDVREPFSSSSSSSSRSGISPLQPSGLSRIRPQGKARLSLI